MQFKLLLQITLLISVLFSSSSAIESKQIHFLLSSFLDGGGSNCGSYCIECNINSCYDCQSGYVPGSGKNCVLDSGGGSATCPATCTGCTPGTAFCTGCPGGRYLSSGTCPGKRNP